MQMLSATVLATTTAVALALAPNATLTQANADLQAGEADKALALLAQQGSGSAEAHNLACRVHMTLQRWDNAVNECEQAVKLDGQNSDYHLWLGRALGEKADRASFLSAYSLAKRVRAEFEEAVRLNPRNVDALADLGEFYKEAPEVVGGGTAKAEGVAQQLDKLNPAHAEDLRASIADKAKDYGTAEREYKQATTVAVHPASQWIELASFYRRHQKWAEMETAITTVVRDKQAGVALFDGALVLIRANRNPELAAKMLESYLAGTSKSEQAPAFVAHLRLATLKDQLGDTAAANRERAQAQAMAHDFNPAQDGKH
jgi:tetratricopeptide (TPR) repeat protein